MQEQILNDEIKELNRKVLENTHIKVYPFFFGEGVGIKLLVYIFREF